MKAIARTTRLTPKKANLLAGMVRTKQVDEALQILEYLPKKAAKILYKLLFSAVSNAVNNFKQDRKTLFVKEIVVNKGPTLKRSVPVSRGRAYPILKRTAHITITLGILTEGGPGKKSTKKSAAIHTAAAEEAKAPKKATEKKTHKSTAEHTKKSSK